MSTIFLHGSKLLIINTTLNTNYSLDLKWYHGDYVKQETSALWQAPGVDGFLSTPFIIQEFTLAIRQLKSGKGQGPDNIPPEFLIHCGPRCLEWLR